MACSRATCQALGEQQRKYRINSWSPQRKLSLEVNFRIPPRLIVLQTSGRVGKSRRVWSFNRATDLRPGVEEDWEKPLVGWREAGHFATTQHPRWDHCRRVSTSCAVQGASMRHTNFDSGWLGSKPRYRPDNHGPEQSSNLTPESLLPPSTHTPPSPPAKLQGSQSLWILTLTYSFLSKCLTGNRIQVLREVKSKREWGLPPPRELPCLKPIKQSSPLSSSFSLSLSLSLELLCLLYNTILAEKQLFFFPFERSTAKSFFKKLGLYPPC